VKKKGGMKGKIIYEEGLLRIDIKDEI